ncbi:MAG: hypothetical protein HY541_00615, partial [Deltaproteobacteria bacterium]|nr:hypothetical protein [Deltaproteobacteria bacterium]
MDLKRVLAFLGEQGILSADEVGNPGEARAVLQGNDGWGVAERALGELGDEAVSLFIQWMGGSVADRPVERSHAAVLQAGSSSPTIVPSAGVGPSILEEVVPGAESNADGHRDDRSDRWPQLYSDFLEVFGVVRVAVSAGDIETLKPLRRASREGGVSLFSDEAMKASRLIREIEGRAPGAIPEYLLTGVMDALGEIFLPIDRSKATIVFIRYDGLFSGGEEAERFIEVIQNCPYVAGFYLENFPESILSGLGDRFPKFRAQEADRDKVNIVLLNGNAVGGKLDPWVVWKEVSNRLSDVYAPPPEGGLWSRYVIRSLGLDDLKPDGTLRDTRTGRRFAVGSYQGLNGPVVGMTRTMDALEPIEEGDFRRSILDHLPALPPGGIRLVHFVPGNSMQNSAIAKGGPDREIVVTIDNWGTARIEAFQTLRGIMVALGFDDSEAIVTAPVFFVGEGESAPVEPAQPALPAARYFHAFLGDGVLSLKPEQQEEVLTAQEVGAMIERAPSGVFSQHVREIRFGKEGEPDFFTLPVSGGGGGTPHPEEGTPDEPDPRNLAGPLSPESTRRMNELVDA